jgi:hypothetical protein
MGATTTTIIITTTIARADFDRLDSICRMAGASSCALPTRPRALVGTLRFALRCLGSAGTRCDGTAVL